MTTTRDIVVSLDETLTKEAVFTEDDRDLLLTTAQVLRSLLALGVAGGPWVPGMLAELDDALQPLLSRVTN